MENEIYNKLLKKYGENLLLSIETTKIIDIEKCSYITGYCKIILEDDYSRYEKIENINIENKYLYILEKIDSDKILCTMFSKKLDDKIITDFYL